MEGEGGHALTLVVVTLAAVTKIDPWGGHRFSQRANLGAGTVVKLSTGPSLSQHRSEHIKGSKQNKKLQQKNAVLLRQNTTCEFFRVMPFIRLQNDS